MSNLYADALAFAAEASAAAADENPGLTVDARNFMTAMACMEPEWPVYVQTQDGPRPARVFCGWVPMEEGGPEGEERPCAMVAPFGAAPGLPAIPGRWDTPTAWDVVRQLCRAFEPRSRVSCGAAVPDAGGVRQGVRWSPAEPIVWYCPDGSTYIGAPAGAFPAAPEGDPAEAVRRIVRDVARGRAPEDVAAAATAGTGTVAPMDIARATDAVRIDGRLPIERLTLGTVLALLGAAGLTLVPAVKPGAVQNDDAPAEDADAEEIPESAIYSAVLEEVPFQ